MGIIDGRYVGLTALDLYRRVVVKFENGWKISRTSAARPLIGMQ